MSANTNTKKVVNVVASKQREESYLGKESSLSIEEEEESFYERTEK